jgi:hypothetical protein
LPWNGQRSPGAIKIQVAEALTEEQARAEILGSVAPRQPASQKKLGATTSPVLMVDRGPNGNLGSSASEDRDESAGSRLKLSLSTASIVAVAGFICVVILGSYSVGRRYAGSPNTLPPAAAVAQKSSPISTSPLLPTVTEQKSSKATSDQSSLRPDLSFLLQPPSKLTSAVTPNQPARVETEVSDRPVVGGENLYYLQIESFRISRDRSGDQLLKDVEAVRKFLAGQGVDTGARRRSNGFILFSKEGYSLVKDQSPQREAFRKKIERLGQEYRRSGGLYQFKGCLFVNHATTKAGDPVASFNGE